MITQNNTRKYNTKKCPRCGEKCLCTQSKCPECGLVFARLLNTSNCEAKRAILKRQKNLIIKSNVWPEDAKRSKALLLCGFLGLFGAHNYYLGRFFKAIFSTICTAICIVVVNLTTYPSWYDAAMSIFGGFLGIPLLLWIIDFIYIAIGKYKIPVAIIGTCPKKDKPKKLKNSTVTSSIETDTQLVEKEDNSPDNYKKQPKNNVSVSGEVE